MTAAQIRTSFAIAKENGPIDPRMLNFEERISNTLGFYENSNNNIADFDSRAAAEYARLAQLGLKYWKTDKSLVDVPMEELAVLATAIVGVHSAPTVLVDLDQHCHPVLVGLGLKVEHP